MFNAIIPINFHFTCQAKPKDSAFYRLQAFPCCHDIISQNGIYATLLFPQEIYTF